MWKGGAVLKAIIMSHENGGSYCIDSSGSFHFVKGYENVDIGTEITIQTKKSSRVRGLWVACAVVVIAVAIAGFTCTKIVSSLNIGAFGRSEMDAVYVRLCVRDSTRYCLPEEACDISCRSY